MELLKKYTDVIKKVQKDINQINGIVEDHSIMGDSEFPDIEDKLCDAYEKTIWAQLLIAQAITSTESDRTLENTIGLTAGYPDMPRPTAKYENGVLEIAVPMVPDFKNPSKKLLSRAAGDRNRLWQGFISNAYKSLKAEERVAFDKALVAIFIYKPGDKVPWDPDNININFIINALKYRGIMPDDSYHYMTYMVKGKETAGNPKTIIRVMDYSKISKIIEG